MSADDASSSADATDAVDERQEVGLRAGGAIRCKEEHGQPIYACAFNQLDRSLFRPHPASDASHLQ